MIKDVNNNSSALFFSIGEKVVYSSHGVGQVKDIETIDYGGSKLVFYVIEFTSQRMSIKVPVNKAAEKGLRAVSEPEALAGVFEILKSKAIVISGRNKTTKFTDYKQKLNSGSIIDLAEIVRDLYKNGAINNSYSQKNIYDSAISRLANELALLKNVQVDQMLADLETVLLARA